MEGGVLQQFDTPQKIKERPANLFTGTFVGEPPMNVFEASVSATDARMPAIMPISPAIWRKRSRPAKTNAAS